MTFLIFYECIIYCVALGLIPRPLGRYILVSGFSGSHAPAWEPILCLNLLPYAFPRRSVGTRGSTHVVLKGFNTPLLAAGIIY